MMQATETIDVEQTAALVNRLSHGSLMLSSLADWIHKRVACVDAQVKAEKAHGKHATNMNTDGTFAIAWTSYFANCELANESRSRKAAAMRLLSDQYDEMVSEQTVRRKAAAQTLRKARDAVIDAERKLQKNRETLAKVRAAARKDEDSLNRVKSGSQSLKEIEKAQKGAAKTKKLVTECENNERTLFATVQSSKTNFQTTFVNTRKACLELERVRLEKQTETCSRMCDAEIGASSEILQIEERSQNAMLQVDAEADVEHAQTSTVQITTSPVANSFLKKFPLPPFLLRPPGTRLLETTSHSSQSSKSKSTKQNKLRQTQSLHESSSPPDEGPRVLEVTLGIVNEDTEHMEDIQLEDVHLSSDQHVGHQDVMAEAERINYARETEDSNSMRSIPETPDIHVHPHEDAGDRYSQDYDEIQNAGYEEEPGYAQIDKNRPQVAHQGAEDPNANDRALQEQQDVDAVAQYLASQRRSSSPRNNEGFKDIPEEEYESSEEHDHLHNDNQVVYRIETTEQHSVDTEDNEQHSPSCELPAVVSDHDELVNNNNNKGEGNHYHVNLAMEHAE